MLHELLDSLLAAARQIAIMAGGAAVGAVPILAGGYGVLMLVRAFNAPAELHEDVKARKQEDEAEKREFDGSGDDNDWDCRYCGKHYTAEDHLGSCPDCGDDYTELSDGRIWDHQSGEAIDPDDSDDWDEPAKE